MCGSLDVYWWEMMKQRHLLENGEMIFHMSIFVCRIDGREGRVKRVDDGLHMTLNKTVHDWYPKPQISHYS